MNGTQTETPTPSDAVAFIQWIIENRYSYQVWSEYWTDEDEKEKYTNDELYRKFKA